MNTRTTEHTPTDTERSARFRLIAIKAHIVKNRIRAAARANKIACDANTLARRTTP